MTADETIAETARLFALWNLECDRQRGVVMDARLAKHYRHRAQVERLRAEIAGLPMDGAGRGYEMAAEMIEEQLTKQAAA